MRGVAGKPTTTTATFLFSISRPNALKEKKHKLQHAQTEKQRNTFFLYKYAKETISIPLSHSLDMAHYSTRQSETTG